MTQKMCIFFKKLKYFKWGKIETKKQTKKRENKTILDWIDFVHAYLSLKKKGENLIAFVCV